MKKPMAHTKVTVKLRKSETRDEWYLYLEKYPVIVPGSDKPKREREYLNRTITTPVFDKQRTARTGADGKSTYKPKRDVNGIIICKSQLDKETCIYADKVREIRQREFDNAAIFTDSEAMMAELTEKSQCDFIAYFKAETKRRHAKSSESIIVNWKRVAELLSLFSKGKSIIFANMNIKLMEEFKRYLKTAPQGGGKSGTLSQNSASTYFSIFKAALKQAFVDGYLAVDIAAKVKGIPAKESRREHLTMEELNILAATPCDRDIMKRAALFSALTGMRHCDIQKMTWGELRNVDGKYRIDFTQEKTEGVEYTPISEQAYQLCGEPREPNQLVFEDLPDPSWISRPLAKWIEAAGIKRHITFHCFRHTYATLQLASGTALTTVSKMLGHTNVRTTQIYAKVVDASKDEATKAIKLDMGQECKL